MTLQHRILAAERLKSLKPLIMNSKMVRVLEAHNALSGLIVDTAVVNKDTPTQQAFDGIWISSFTDSAAKGHPDVSIIDVSSRLQTIQQIIQVTQKPLLVDGETGGEDYQFEYFCSKLELMGVSAVIIEDKKFPKRNSLDKEAIHFLENPEAVAKKIERAKKSCLSKDFMIFARIESFTAGKDIEDAIYRAQIYLDSQADGILIHSRDGSPWQIYAFAERYHALCHQMGITKPLACIPTSYSQVYESELIAHGFSLVIYANQLLRAAHKAMRQTSISILSHGRASEAEEALSSMQEICEDTGYSDLEKKDVQHEGQ